MKQRQYNLDKTAYDVRKKKIEDLFGSFLHICTSSYFFVQIQGDLYYVWNYWIYWKLTGTWNLS